MRALLVVISLASQIYAQESSKPATSPAVVATPPASPPPPPASPTPAPASPSPPASPAPPPASSPAPPPASSPASSPAPGGGPAPAAASNNPSPATANAAPSPAVGSVSPVSASASAAAKNPPPSPPPAPCGFSSVELTDSCSSYCLSLSSKRTISVETCAAICIDAGIWSWKPKPCSSPTSTPSSPTSSPTSSSSWTTTSSSSTSSQSACASASPPPCGWDYMKTSEKCKQYCLVHEISGEICQQSCKSNCYPLYETKSCTSSPSSSTTFTTSISSSSESSSSSTTTTSSSSSTTQSNGCPTPSPPACGYNTTSISESCQGACAEVDIGSEGCIAYCLEACFTPHDPLPCISTVSSTTTSSTTSSSSSSSSSTSSSCATPSVPACGYNTTAISSQCQFACGEGIEGCTSYCEELCIPPYDPLPCTSSTTSSSSTLSSSSTSSTPPCASPSVPACGYNTSRISTECNSACGELELGTENCLAYCGENCLPLYAPLPCTSSISSTTSSVPSTTSSVRSTSSATSSSPTSSPSSPSSTPTSSPTSTTSSSSRSISCGPVCEIDGFATLLIYPTAYVPSQYYLTTLDVHTTIYVDGITARTTTTITAPPPPPPPPTRTWVYQGLTLTFPTTYVAYTDFSHTKAIPDLTALTCATTANDVTLGQPTNWASLVFPTGAVPAGGDTLPGPLLNYLNGLPVVQQQLGGTAVSNCDPQQGGSAQPASATATQTTAELVGSLTVQDNAPVTVTTPFAQEQPPAEVPVEPPPAPANPPPPANPPVAQNPPVVQDPPPPPPPAPAGPTTPAANPPAPNTPAANSPAATPSPVAPVPGSPQTPGPSPSGTSPIVGTFVGTFVTSGSTYTSTYTATYTPAVQTANDASKTSLDVVKSHPWLLSFLALFLYFV